MLARGEKEAANEDGKDAGADEEDKKWEGEEEEEEDE
jgi:hypothetical protein